MDASVFDGVFEFVTTAIAIAVISVFAWIIYGCYCFFNDSDDGFVTKEKLVPEMRFVTDGKVIDTVYFYKVK